MKRLKIKIIQPDVIFDKKEFEAVSSSEEESAVIEKYDKLNAAHAIELLSNIQKNDYDLIAFPELYPRYLKPLCSVATKLNTCILAGELVEEKGKLYNSMTLIRPDGKQERYYKRNLVPSDLEFGFSPGEKPGLFDVKGVKGGVLTCYDLANAGLIEVLHSADILVNPSCAQPAYVENWKNDLLTVCAEYGKPILAINTTLFEGFDAYYGGGKSKIMVPRPDINPLKLKRPINPADFILDELGASEGCIDFVYNSKNIKTLEEPAGMRMGGFYPYVLAMNTTTA